MSGKPELAPSTEGLGSGKRLVTEAKALAQLERHGASSLREQIATWVNEGGAGGEGN